MKTSTDFTFLVHHASFGSRFQRYHRHRREAREDIKALIESFPRAEFDAFWEKFSEAIGNNQEVFRQRLAENDVSSKFSGFFKVQGK